MADRYWFGGTNSWVSQNSGYWAASAPAGFIASQSGTTLTIASGGTPAIGNAVVTNAGAFLGTITGGSGTTWTLDTSATVASTQMYAATIASYPTAAVDSVFFGYVSTGSSSLPHTVTLTSSNSCLDFRRDSNPVTIAGTGALTIAGSLIANNATWSQNGGITFTSTSTGRTIQTAGTISSAITFSGAGGGWSLAAALTTTGAITVTQGTFTTNNYSVTATALASSNANTRAINLGSSTVTLSTGATPINFAVGTNLTFNAGTSQIICSGAGLTISGGGQTFYNLSITNTVWVVASILGSNTFNNLSVVGTTSAGTSVVSIAADQAVNGTLTLSAGSDATTRAFVRSDVIGVTRTLTVNSFAAGSADIDFRDITIAGAASPVSGTRFGNCKGNSGITFPAAKTVYWNLVAGGNWSATGWATNGGGTPAVNNLPLAQDTAVFQSTGLNSAATITINANYNIGTIDMSARTTNTMTLATGTTTPAFYGNWINGTGTTISGTGTMTFAGRSSQTITSAGKTFTQDLTINSPSGAVTLQDAIIAAGTQLTLTLGTFDANGYNCTIPRFTSSGTGVRTAAIGSGTWTVTSGGTGCWAASTSTNLTVTGTGTISLTTTVAKTFAGGGIQTYPTLNQGGTGALTITGSNKFARMTNTAIGSVLFTGGTTNEFTTSFSLNGAAGTPLTLGSTTTTQAILKKPTSWQMGLLSTNAGNNTGLTFLASDGTMEYLSVSYINGQVTSGAVTHTSSGAVSGPGTSVAGSSTRFRVFGSTGVISGTSALVNGTARSQHVFTTSGNLTGPGTNVFGMSERFRAFDSSGNLIGSGALINGTSVRFRVFDSSGVLTGQGSTIAGTSVRFRAFVASGDLTGPGAEITGNGIRFRAFDATGDLFGTGAVINGAAFKTITHAAIGDLIAAGAVVAGSVVHINLYPDPADVREGVQYGPGGIYTGTLTVVEGETIIRLRSFTERF